MRFMRLFVGRAAIENVAKMSYFCRFSTANRTIPYKFLARPRLFRFLLSLAPLRYLPALGRFGALCRRGIGQWHTARAESNAVCRFDLGVGRSAFQKLIFARMRAVFASTVARAWSICQC